MSVSSIKEFGFHEIDVLSEMSYTVFEIYDRRLEDHKDTKPWMQVDYATQKAIQNTVHALCQNLDLTIEDLHQIFHQVIINEHGPELEEDLTHHVRYRYQIMKSIVMDYFKHNVRIRPI